MALLTGQTADGREVPVQVDAQGRLVAEGLSGPQGPQGEQGPKGADSTVPGPVGPAGPAATIGGTAAAPGLAVSGSPTTGLYSPGADRLAISTGGTGRLFVAADGRVGIGTSAPVSAFDVVGNISTRPVASGDGGILQFYGNTGAAAGTTIKSTFSTGGHGPLIFDLGNGEKCRIDSSGRLLVGTITARSYSNGVFTPRLQIEGPATGEAALGIARNVANTGGPVIAFGKSRGAGAGAVTAVIAQDDLGRIQFQGADGAQLQTAAEIWAVVDGTPATGSVPGRLIFSTTAAGSAAPVERMRIKPTGIVNIVNTPTYADNTAAKAGGLVAGDIYRTATGQLMIAF